MAQLPPDLTKALDALDVRECAFYWMLSIFQERLSSLEKQVGPLLEVPLADLNEKLSPLDQARLNVLLAYSINSLFFSTRRICPLRTNAECSVSENTGNLTQQPSGQAGAGSQMTAPLISLVPTDHYYSPQERVRLYLKKVKAIAGERPQANPVAKRFIMANIDTKDKNSRPQEEAPVEDDQKKRKRDGAGDNSLSKKSA
jgi:hypothetical protein